ncbi:MAG: serine/threonine protein kinase, partial [Candidatus Riflebacteria bacterium]|nr:serine/threonine protein kinase [Candidatus Riflebacteria bacterium]
MSEYEVSDLLGRGGMGLVYHARQKTLGRVVALKFLGLPDVPIDREALLRFEREARALASLSHPCIVKVFDFGVMDGRPFISMELVDGASLRDLITRCGGLPFDQVLSVLGQVLDALEHLHSRGLVHRDIKPSNIMVEPGGRAVLMDFGLVLLPGRTMLTEPGTTLGTPWYLSPEAVEGLPCSSASDLWSLGAAAYEMATGCKAFSGATPMQLFSSILAASPLPLETRRVDVPPPLALVIRGLLQRDPEKRWASAALARHALLDPRPSTAARRSAPAVPGRAVQRGPVPWRWARVGLAAMGFVVAVGLGSTLSHQPARPGGPSAAPAPSTVSHPDRIRTQIGSLVDTCYGTLPSAAPAGRVRDVLAGLDRVTGEASRLPAAARMELWRWHERRPGLCELFCATSEFFRSSRGEAGLDDSALLPSLARLEDREEPLWWVARGLWLSCGLPVDGSDTHRSSLGRLHAVSSVLVAAVLALPSRSSDSVPVFAEVAGHAADLLVDRVDQDLLNLSSLYLVLLALERIDAWPA